MSKIIILETERLILRRFRNEDIPLMAAISGDKNVMLYFPDTQTLEETEQFITHINEHHEQYGYSLYAVELKESKEFAGFIGLNCPTFKIPHFTPKCLPIVEIGWRLASHFWGKGYATEGAKAVLNHALSDCSLKEVISFTAKINTPSIRVMEKIGLKRDKKDDFLHPKLSEDSPLKAHVLFRKCIKS